MADQRVDAAERGAPPATVEAGGVAPRWQQTLWAMVGIQFIMTMAFSVLTPIMPLFLPELGVTGAAAIDLWAGILNGTTSFVAAFASPLWGRVADRHGRKLMLLRSSLAIGFFTALMGVAANVWQFFAFRALMGAFAGFSASRSPWWPARCRKTGSAIRSAGSAPGNWSARWSARSSAASWRTYRQLSHPVLTAPRR